MFYLNLARRPLPRGMDCVKLKFWLQLNVGQSLDRGPKGGNVNEEMGSIRGDARRAEGEVAAKTGDEARKKP